MSDLADRFRREGMADAVVILVARRFRPEVTAEDWGRVLGLQQHEVRAAVERFRAGRVTVPTSAPRALPTPEPRQPRLSMQERLARNQRIRALRAQGTAVEQIAYTVGLTASRVRQILGGR